MNFFQRFSKGAADHLYSWWYSQSLGKVGRGSIIRSHCRLEGNRLNKVKIGSNCDIDSYCIIGCSIRLFEKEKPVEPELSIGDDCVIGQYSHITAVKEIRIGNNLLTGRFVLITDNNHGDFDYNQINQHPIHRPIVSNGEVIVGNNVWIGDKVTILSGVHIGDGCIIGANSVVTHDIPAYSLAVGSPAKVIKTINLKR